MRRYWVNEKAVLFPHVTLTGDEFHHICRVCRQDLGSRFEVLVSGGKAYFVEIIEVLGSSAKAIIKQERDLPLLPKPYIHLVLSLPKFQTFENILEKSVELGVYEITPIVSDYSFLKNPQHPSFKKKRDRWEKIIKGATQQCGRGEWLKLNPICSLEEIIEVFKNKSLQFNDTGLFSYEGNSELDIHSHLGKMKKRILLGEHIWLFVGSEGGFSFDEVKRFDSIGLSPVTLGSQVLRVETACITLISIIKYELGFFASE